MSGKKNKISELGDSVSEKELLVFFRRHPNRLVVFCDDLASDNKIDGAVGFEGDLTAIGIFLAETVLNDKTTRDELYPLLKKTVELVETERKKLN
jgi:hypothetical protein